MDWAIKCKEDTTYQEYIDVKVIQNEYLLNKVILLTPFFTPDYSLIVYSFIFRNVAPEAELG